MAILSWLGKFVLEFLLNKVIELAKGIYARLSRHKEIDKQAEESVKPIEDAKTEEEIDKAAKDILGGL